MAKRGLYANIKANFIAAAKTAKKPVKKKT